MPNTLAHIGVNGFLSKPLFKRSDLLWIYTGCVLPDIPWITQRLTEILFTNLNGYDIKSYAIIQSSLIFCLVLSTAFASVSKNFVRTFSILSLGSLLHLILDSMQTKWANGVNLFAPFSWEMLNLELFWPESNFTYVLTFTGIVFFIINIRHLKASELSVKFDSQSLKYFLPLILIYFLLPRVFLNNIEESDAHYLTTLRNHNERAGKYVELDRKRISYNETTKSTWIELYNDEIVELSGIPLLNCSKLSIRGYFINNDLIEVKEYKENWAFFRDGASYVGLLIIVFAWIFVLFRKISADE